MTSVTLDLWPINPKHTDGYMYGQATPQNTMPQPPPSVGRDIESKWSQDAKVVSDDNYYCKIVSWWYPKFRIQNINYFWTDKENVERFQDVIRREINWLIIDLNLMRLSELRRRKNISDIWMIISRDKSSQQVKTCRNERLLFYNKEFGMQRLMEIYDSDCYHNSYRHPIWTDGHFCKC